MEMELVSFRFSKNLTLLQKWATLPYDEHADMIHARSIYIIDSDDNGLSHQDLRNSLFYLLFLCLVLPPFSQIIFCVALCFHYIQVYIMLINYWIYFILF